jgi:hypothetical protein
MAALILEPSTGRRAEVEASMVESVEAAHGDLARYMTVVRLHNGQRITVHHTLATVLDMLGLGR